MKQEKLMQALTDVGDDLLEMANHRRFPNHWKLWGRTAACLALVLCLTAVALPYFPRGCGAATETAATEDLVAESTVSEEPQNDQAAPPESVESEIETITEGYTVQILIAGRWYEKTGELLPELPEGLTELGLVEETTDPALMECAVFESEDPASVYVKTEEGYWLFTEIS